MAQTAEAPEFTPAERDFIRTELDQFFSSFPSVAEGFMVKTWWAGPNVGQPKLRRQAQGLCDKGLMHVDTSVRPPRLFFTDSGMAALRAMFADVRYVDQVKFRHVRVELGLELVGNDERHADATPDGPHDSRMIQGSRS